MGEQNKVSALFPDFWPNPGQERLQFDSGRRDVELASVFTSVASLAVSFESECIFWSPVEIKVLKYARATAREESASENPGNVTDM